MKRHLLFPFFFLLILFSGFMMLRVFSQKKSDFGESISVPFKLYFNELFFQATINKSDPLWIILDSGASEFVIDEKSAEELKLPIGDVIDQGYAGIGENRVFEKEIKNIRFKIQNSEMFVNSCVYAWSFEMIEKVLGHRVDAVCGRQLFEKYVIEIDYSKSIFKLYNPDNYIYQGKGSIIPIIIDGVPYMKATVILSDNKRIDGLFMIDTGMHGALSFTSKFCRENNLYKEIKTIKSIGVGGGGSSENQVGRIKAVTIGGYKVDNPITSLSNDTKGGMSRTDIAGLIGNEILKRFKVIFDYANNRVIFEPSDSLNNPMEWDMSGLFLYTTGRNFDQINVYQVLPDSPADLAGIKPGDQLVFIDGVKASNYSIDEISRMFKIENKQYRLGIIRNEKSTEVTINLKRII